MSIGLVSLMQSTAAVTLIICLVFHIASKMEDVRQLLLCHLIEKTELDDVC